MKQIPILFSTAMVQAILAGRKTMTRRTRGLEFINDSYCEWKYLGVDSLGYLMRNEYGATNAVKCPYGQPGIPIYVREEYYQVGHWEQEPGKKTKTGRMKWKFIPDSAEILYEAPVSFRKGRHHKDSGTSAFHKRLARFMPKKASRIWLEVTDIRVERLQDMKEAEVKAEGAGDEVRQMWLYGLDAKERDVIYRRSFQRLWESINGTESWDANPWVWVVSFKVLSTTGKPAELKIENLS